MQARLSWAPGHSLGLKGGAQRKDEAPGPQLPGPHREASGHLCPPASATPTACCVLSTQASPRAFLAVPAGSRLCPLSAHSRHCPGCSQTCTLCELFLSPTSPTLLIPRRGPPCPVPPARGLSAAGVLVLLNPFCERFTRLLQNYSVYRVFMT